MGVKQFYVRDETTGSTFFIEDKQAADSLSPYVVNESSVSTAYTYNGDGTVATSALDGALSTYTYNGDGTVHTVVRPTGQVETFTYDGSSKVTGSTVA